MVLIFIIFTLSIFSEESILKNDFSNLKDGNFYLKKNDYIKFSLIIGAAVAGDEKIRDIVQKNKSKAADSYIMKVNDLGHPLAVIPVFAAGYGTGVLLKDEKLKECSISSAESAALAGSIVMAGKFIFGRARPYKDEGNMKFEPFLFKGDDYSSFPSGHSAIAWAMATPYAENYGRWIYILPASVSLARVYKDKHWSSDVAAGAIIGFVIGNAVNRWKIDEEDDFVLYPNGFVIKY